MELQGRVLPVKLSLAMWIKVAVAVARVKQVAQTLFLPVVTVFLLP
jgi:hypothetical protein